MVKRKLLVILLLVSASCLISFGTFNLVVRQVNSNQNKKDSVIVKVHTDTLQTLINEYCSAKSVRQSLENKIRDKNAQIVESKDLIQDLESRQKKYEQKKYDSLVVIIKASISSIKKQNNYLQKDIESLEAEALKSTPPLESSLKKVKDFTSKARGSLHFNFCNIRYDLFVADLDSDEIRMHLFKKEKQNFYSLGAVHEYLKGKKIDPLMITNAGMYTPTNEPEGLYLEEDTTIQYELDTTKRNTDENFYLSPNGVFFIDSCNVPYIETTEDFLKIFGGKKIKAKIATQSGPMLLINGKMHDKFLPNSHNEKIRSGVGKISDNKIVFAITLDPSNFYDFASSFRDIFNCKDALFLDGAISLMYLKDVNPHVTGGNFGPMISVSRK